jgi:hypothetical protein
MSLNRQAERAGGAVADEEEAITAAVPSKATEGRYESNPVQLEALVGMPHRRRSVHHAQHRGPARFQESPNQQAR